MDCHKNPALHLDLDSASGYGAHIIQIESWRNVL